MRGLRWCESQGSVGPMAVVVTGEDAKGMPELLVGYDQKPIEALRANGPHEPLRHAVCLRGPERRANDLNPLAAKHLSLPIIRFLLQRLTLPAFTDSVSVNAICHLAALDSALDAPRSVCHAA